LWRPTTDTDRSPEGSSRDFHALASRSLSAYLVYQLLNADAQNKAAAYSNNPDIRFEYTVISNIYSAGLPPLEAGSVVAERFIARERTMDPMDEVFRTTNGMR